MKKNLLLLTLVHPDFLPPVYAYAQVLRDLGYKIHILTFDSYVPAEYDLGGGIELETMGKHYDISMSQRLSLRNKYIKRAQQLVNDETLTIITVCPFSFLCGLKIKKKSKLIYVALEIADFILSKFVTSPLSHYRNLLTFRHISKADLVATPSAQRSAWLAGRCHLGFMPYTILNTSYLSDKPEEDTLGAFKEIVPADFLDKKIILYTGAVNADQCILELAQAFNMVNEEQSALIITGIKDNNYCNEILNFVRDCWSAKRIMLFPYLTRHQMLALQSNAHIGVCISKEKANNVESYMIAPNKVGEYANKSLYILGLMSEYMKPFEMQGIASLAETPTKEDISKAIADALRAVNESGWKGKIKMFVKDYFCMQQQLKPVIQFLNSNIKVSD